MQSHIARVGGTGAFVVAVVYMVVSLNYLRWPVSATPAELMQLLRSNPAFHYISTLGFALIAIMMIPVITALTELLQRANAGMVRWAAVIGYIGCGGTIMSNFRMLRLVPARAEAFLEGDEMIRTAIQYNWIGNSLDPDGWLFFGALGFWTLVTAWTVLREGNLFPRSYGYLGFAVAALLFLALLGNLLLPALGTAAAGLGGLVVGPAWSVWTGILLRRQAASAERLSLPA